MAQGRFLNKTISLSEKFALLPNDTARLIATWCIPHLDKNGVTYGDARKVRALVVPMLDLTTSQVNEAIAAMNDFGLIRLFNVNGEMWMHWPGFANNQTMSALARERTSFPAPPIDQPQTHQPAQNDDMHSHANASEIQTLANDEQAIASNYMQPHETASNSMLNIKEKKGREIKEKEDIANANQNLPAEKPQSAKPQPPPSNSKPLTYKSKADPRTNHAAIQAIYQITKRMPPLATYDLIIETVGETPDGEKLKRCFAQWVAKGYNPQNISGVLEWYTTNIPEPRKQSQSFAPRQTKGEMQMSNIEAGISAFLAGGDD